MGHDGGLPSGTASDLVATPAFSGERSVPREILPGVNAGGSHTATIRFGRHNLGYAESVTCSSRS